MHIHFIAIGGSAMHNLALALHDAGHRVSGSDDHINEPSRGRLERAGLLPPEEGWFPHQITAAIDRIILGMHAKPDNPELLRASELGLTIQSYPEFLHEINAQKKRVVIGGSHGKTTITSMLMHALRGTNVQFNYMVGAQLEGFERMVELQSEGEWAILEGDEYLSSPIDRRPKFLWYEPEVALLSSIAWDHINVFPTEAEYAEQFSLFLKTVLPGGVVVWCQENTRLAEIIASCGRKDLNWVTYQTPKHKTLPDGLSELTFPDGAIIHTTLVGAHNYQNIAGARELARIMNVNLSAFDSAIEHFKGAARRLETFSEGERFTVYRDFAHAPSKVSATTTAVKAAFPLRKLTAVFELHTFSSLNAEFLPTYANALEAADEAIVFYSPAVLTQKGLPALDPEFIRSCFGGDSSLQIMTDVAELEQVIGSVSLEHRTILLMSSGWFQGADFSSSLALS